MDGMPRGVRVKNRAPAAIQITAEQILVESRERAEAAAPPAPRRHITDPAELSEHRMRVRKEYEDRLRRLNKSLGTWLRYAKWEEGQGEITRARSIYERTLDVDPKEPGVWLRYAEWVEKTAYETLRNQRHVAHPLATRGDGGLATRGAPARDTWRRRACDTWRRRACDTC